jgi:hypothetical protein
LVIIKTDPHEGKVHRFDHASQLVVVHQSFKENTAKEREREKKKRNTHEPTTSPTRLSASSIWPLFHLPGRQLRLES